jgi:hypothetical protein
MKGPSQMVGFRRDLYVTAERLADHVVVEHTSLDVQEVTVVLTWEPDFSDLFVARGYDDRPVGRVGVEEPEPGLFRYAYESQWMQCAVAVHPTGFERTVPGLASATFRLAPRERVELAVQVTITPPVSELAAVSLPTYEEW